MKCKDIINKLNCEIPECYACDWDNVGLLVGSDEKEVKRILVAVDVTDEVIEEAVAFEADMIISHHPLIFSGIKQINNQNFITKRILELIQKDISYYAMHTNYDIVKMADLASEKLGLNHVEPLEVTDVEKQLGLGKIGELSQKMTVKALVDKVKESFGLHEIKVFGDLEREVSCIAMLPGSGKSEIDLAIQKGAEVYITGDIGHHEGIDANARNLVILDAGHYGIEHIFMKDMVDLLHHMFPEIAVESMEVTFPFCTI